MSYSDPITDDYLSIKDRNLILLIMAKGAQVVRTRREGSTVWFYFDKKIAQPIVDDFLHNRPIPLEDARSFIIATATFNFIVKEIV